MSSSDRTTRVGLRELFFRSLRRAALLTSTPSGTSATRDPPADPAQPTFVPRNRLHLIAWILGSSSRTGRLVAVLLTIGGCIAGIIRVIQFQPVMWAYVFAAAYIVQWIVQRVRNSKDKAHLLIISKRSHYPGPPE